MERMIEHIKNREDGIAIADDFQGWPIYKRTLKWILEELGAKEAMGDVKASEKFTAFIVPNELLNKYPEVLEDDGMGYSPNIKYITDSEIYEGTPRIWIDMEDPNYNRTVIEDDSYSAVPWPIAQDYFDEPWFKDEVCFDSSKNLWFIPNKYIN